MSRSSSHDFLCFTPKYLVVVVPINVLYDTYPRCASVAVVFGHLAECVCLDHRLMVLYGSRRGILSWHQSTWCMVHAHVALRCNRLWTSGGMRVSRSSSRNCLCFAPKCLVVAPINVVYGTCPRCASVAIVFGHLAECVYLGRRFAIVYVSRRSVLP